MTASHSPFTLSTMTELTIIVASDKEGGIGIDNTLPWRLPEDLAHFKRLTTGHPIIMGRKTFDSIGRPLPNRRNIVLTRQPDWQHAGVEAVSSLDAACALIGAATAFVIGGAEIYAQALPRCHQLIVTEIDHNFKCDAVFPKIDPQYWRESGRNTFYSASNAFHYAFVTYIKI